MRIGMRMRMGKRTSVGMGVMMGMGMGKGMGMGMTAGGCPQVLAGGLHQRASSSSSQDSGLYPWPGGTPVSPGLREEKVSTHGDTAGTPKLHQRGPQNRTKGDPQRGTVCPPGPTALWEAVPAVTQHSTAGPIAAP